MLPHPGHLFAKKKNNYLNLLEHIQTIKVRFSEVDSMQIIWHGNYIKYFEDGREGFGRKYGIGYLDVYKNQLRTPIVDLKISFKKMVSYGDEIEVHTIYEHSPACKLVFKYKIYNEQNDLVAEGSTVQVFVDENHQLLLSKPEFLINWEKKWL